jgi:hypothetical protein
VSRNTEVPPLAQHARRNRGFCHHPRFGQVRTSELMSNAAHF